MKLSDETLQMLAGFITAIATDKARSRRENLITNEIIDFFLVVKEEEHLNVSSTIIPLNYAVEVLKEHNGTIFIKKTVENLLLPEFKYNQYSGRPYDVENKNELARIFVPYLERDNYKLVALRKTIEHSNINGIYYHVLDENEFAETPAMEESKQVQDIITKAKERFAREDYEGAISSSFNLAETVIKKLLDDLNIPYKKTAQFIDLYPTLSNELNLNPAGENIEGRLKPILQGLKSQAEGLYHLANKASDRHPPKHIPKRQDAKLAMNAAFTLCEYLSDTHKSRQAQ